MSRAAAAPDPQNDADLLTGLLAHVRAVYQPVVELETRAVVGYEALARGPVDSPLASPLAMFALAKERDLVVELDRACRDAAVQGVLAGSLAAPLGLFLNAEPAALDIEDGVAVEAMLDRLDPDLPVVLEITERALTADPAGLLRGADRARRRGWRIAVDDVGADRASLALLPFLRPDIIKLDLRLVQARATADVAEIITAVNAYAERTGALVLAEGIETEEHARTAVMMGATLGQGYLYGRPGPLPTSPVRQGSLLAQARLQPSMPQVLPVDPAATPYELVEKHPGIRRSTKPLLVAISRQLERHALSMGNAAVTLATFQTSKHFPASTARRYRTLGTSGAFVAAFGAGLGSAPAPGVRGVDLAEADPLTVEWDVIVTGPHFTAALLTRDLGDAGPDDERRFDYLVTYDRELVLAAATLLLCRVPAEPAALTPATPVHAVEPDALDGKDVLVRRRRQPRAVTIGPARLDAILSSAGVSSPHGLTIADATDPELPLVWVNPAFVELTGYSEADSLGRSCRFLQGPGTDRETLLRLRSQLSAGRTSRVLLRNYRQDGSAFWNDLQVVPVHNDRGALTHYVGQQHDVTERVEAQLRVEYLAYHDTLTGLANRERVREHLLTEIARARRSGTSVALLFLDLDHFKAVNDEHGHQAGDDVLLAVGQRLQAATREGDLLARRGGDEFLLVVAGLRDGAAETAVRRAQDLLTSLDEPVPVGVQGHQVGASIGISLFPADAGSAAELLDHADEAMYRSKQAGRDRVRLYGG